jgi:hypothetical protein
MSFGERHLAAAILEFNPQQLETRLLFPAEMC